MMAQDPRYAGYDIGEWTYGHPEIRVWEHGAKLKIGRYCSIADGVKILVGGEHRTDWVTTYPFAELMPGAEASPKIGCAKGDIAIENDVWIGQDALVLSGVTVGNGAVVAARSVLTRDVPAYAIVGGNPAKFIRYRISEQFIPALQAIAWWNWPKERVLEAQSLLLSADIQRFISMYGPESEGSRVTVRSEVG